MKPDKPDKFYHVKYIIDGIDRFEMMSALKLASLYRTASVIVEHVNETIMNNKGLSSQRQKPLSKKQIELLVRQNS